MFIKTFAAVCVIAGGLMCGCASDKPKQAAPQAPAPKPEPEPVSLAQMKQELLEAKAQIAATSDALVKLQKSSQADAQANYNKFTEEFIKLQGKADQVKSRAEDLKAKSAAYHAMWDKQMGVENPELKARVVQAKAEAEQVYNTISSEMELARMTFASYMQNLKDVGNYLRGNLSPASLNSAGDLVTKADGQGKQVNQHIDAIIAAADKIMAATGEAATAQPAMAR